VIAAASFVASACSGGGCGGCPGQSGNYTFPANRIEERVVKARLTKAGIDFLKPRLKELIKSFLGVDSMGRARFEIPAGQVFNLGNPSGYLNASMQLQEEPNGSNPGIAGRASIDFSSLDLQLLAGPPAKVRLSVRDALVDVDVRFLAQWLGDAGDAACYVRGNTARGTPQQRALLLDIDIDATLEVDAQSNFHTTVSFPTLRTRDLDIRVDAAPDTDPFCDDGFISSECRTFCGATDILTSVVTALRDFLGGFIDGALRALLPPVIQNLVNGRPLKFQGELALASLAGGILPSLRTARPLGYLVQPGPDGFVVDGTGETQGLNLAMNGGLESSPTHACVPPLEPLPLFTPGPFPPLDGRDSQGRTYHLALTLSDAFLNEGGVAAYTSGALCLMLGSADIARATGGRFNLTAGALALLVPGLRELAGENAPILIQVTPTSAPSFRFGTGQGVGDTRDSLIHLELKGLHLGFYALIADRMARLFEFNADVVVGLSIVVLPANELQITVDRVKIDKLTQTYNELFRSTDLQSALGLIVELATGALLGQGLSFEVDVNSSLPDALRGVLNVQVNEIVRDGSNQDFLTLSLTLTDPSMRPARFVADTSARVAPGEEAMARDLEGRRFATGRVVLEVEGRGRHGAEEPGELEYQHRLDGGPWSAFAPGPRLYIDDPRLLVIGEHEVLVRARVVGSPLTIDRSPAVVRFVVDPLAPRLTLARSDDGAAIRFDVKDELTPPERILLSWRMDEGRFTEPMPAGAFAASGLPIVSLPDGETLHVRAHDEAGNVSEPVSTRVRATHGRTSASPQPGCGGSGCSAGGSSAPWGAWLLLLAALALPLRRSFRFKGSRRRTATLVVAAIVLVPFAVLLTACGDSKGNTCTADAQCPTGFRCIAERCAPLTRCDDPTNPTPCCPGQICSSAGTCIDVVDSCTPEGTCEKPGKTCSSAGQGPDGGPGAGGICSYKTCTRDSDCGNAASCFNGFCRTPTPCSAEGGCGDDEVCITPTDTCYPAPDACLNVSCGEGQIRVFENVAAQIGSMCNLKNAVCVCADIPQITRGDWGRDSRIAVRSGGAPVVSAYDKTYGDLVLARYDTSGAFESLEYVDGVPSGAPVVGRPTGVRGGVTSPGPNVGRYTSIAIDSSSNVIIAYYDVDNADLKFAVQSGASWATHTVDSGGDVGRYAHLVIGPGGAPFIAYFQKRGANDTRTGLKIARAKNASPRTAADWDVSFVESAEPPAPAPRPCGGTCSSPNVCIRANVDGGPGQRCVAPDGASACSPACANTHACVAARCEERVPEPPTPLDDLPEGVGLFPSLSFSAAGVTHVVYYDRTNGNLRGARAGAASPATEDDWQKATIDGVAGTFVDGDVGLWPSLGFLPDGKMIVAYEDATNDDLVAYVGADFTGGAREIIDTGMLGSPLQLVGADAALAVAPSGEAFVAYQDATQNDLKLARRTGTNTWELSTILSDGAWGFFSDLAISNGKLYISSLKLGFDVNAQPQNELRVVIRSLP
jgi:hypothetical protein